MNLKKTIVTIVLIAAAVGLGYSLYVTIKSGASESGVVSNCSDDGKCIWTAHIHAYVSISICGEDYRLPIERGSLTGPHTHEEKNIAHWHDKLPYDSATNQVTETEPLTLGAFFDAIGVPFDWNRIADKANGDSCPDERRGTVKVFTNGEPIANPRDYLWGNRDVVMIFFDSRTPEETAREVAGVPLKFPSLGRG